MSVRQGLVPALALVLLGASSPTLAQAQVFTGNVNVTQPAFFPVPDLARCGANPPNARLDWPVMPGTSSFGAFTLASSNCVNGATGSFFNGLFTFNFGGTNTLFGTYVGTIGLPLPPPVGVPTPISETLTISGGTGTFAGASGTITAVGFETINANGTFDLRLDYTGTVSTVPEPATVLLLAGGLVGLGVVARRRKRTA